jgi:hypothetical protein
MPVEPFRIFYQTRPESGKVRVDGLKYLYFIFGIIIGAMAIQKRRLSVFVGDPVKTTPILFGADIEIEFPLHKSPVESRKVRFGRQKQDTLLGGAKSYTRPPRPKCTDIIRIPAKNYILSILCRNTIRTLKHLKNKKTVSSSSD